MAESAAHGPAGIREVRSGISPPCSCARIIRWLWVPSIRGRGIADMRDWYVPKPASSRSRLVTGDDQVACWMWEGW